MKIGINLLFLYEITGVGVYVKNLLEEIGKIDKNDIFYIFTSKNPPEEIFFNYSNFNYIKMPFNSSSKVKRIIFEQLILPFYVKRLNIDILFNPSVFNPFFVSCKKITTIHDIWFLSNKYANLKNFYLNFVTYSAKNSKLIITVSNFSKEEIKQKLNINEGHVKVIYQGIPKLENTTLCEEKEIKNKVFLNRPYFFYIGLIEPRKNIENIIKSFKIFKMKYPGFKFVFAGRIVKELINIEKIVSEKKFLENEVIFRGRISEKEKIVLYKNSKALIFPSLHEGFGLPVLEAQSLGVPVLASNVTALPEIAGVGALYVNPYDVEDIARGMEKIAFDEKLREDLIKKGYENVRRFSWEKATDDILKIFKEVHENTSGQ